MLRTAPVHPSLSRVSSPCTSSVQLHGHAHGLPGKQRCSRRQRGSTHMQYQADSARGVKTGPQQGSGVVPGPHQSGAVQLTADQIMLDMRTMLGGISTEHFTGYAGQWRTWEVINPQDPGTADTPTTDDVVSSANTETQPAAPPAAFSSSSGHHAIRLIDDSINVRLWRVVNPEENPQPTASDVRGRPQAQALIQQANFYHHPGKMAGPSTRFASYLTGNTMSGRPDGYGLRVWSFTQDSEMLQPDASNWLTGQGTPAECSMRVLTGPHVGTTIINGALPSGFEEGHTPRFWVLEFIAKEASSTERRWASMNWYDLGELVVNRSINEDLLHLAGEPDDIRICPDDIHFSSRRQGLLPLDIDNWVSQYTRSEQGTATVFSFTDPNRADGTASPQHLLLTRTSAVPCTWTNPFATASTGSTQPPAAEADSSLQTTGVASGTGNARQQQQEVQQQGTQAERVGPGVDVCCQVYPDLSYCRVPRSIKEVVASGSNIAMFEAGSVMRDGTLVRWLLEYETSGKRLIRTARFETYPPAQEKV